MWWRIALWAAGGLVALCAGAVVLNWDKIIVALKGKKVAILGARKVGKTTLIRFLLTGSLPESYKQTLKAEKFSGCRRQLKDLDLKIQDTVDVSGSEDAYSDWKKLHDKADVVCYLVRADLIFSGDLDHEDRVRRDMDHIGGWLEDRSTRPLFFIIATYCDLIPDFSTLPAEKKGDFVDEFRNPDKGFSRD